MPDAAFRPPKTETQRSWGEEAGDNVNNKTGKTINKFRPVVPSTAPNLLDRLPRGLLTKQKRPVRRRIPGQKGNKILRNYPRIFSYYCHEIMTAVYIYVYVCFFFRTPDRTHVWSAYNDGTLCVRFCVRFFIWFTLPYNLI